MTTLLDRLSEFEDRLLSLTRRQFILEAFVTEWERVSRQKECKFWNGSHWLMILDFRDMHVTHLASWAKAVYEPGGLIRQIQGCHVAELFLTSHAAAAGRLFPGVAAVHPAPTNVEALIGPFKAEMDPVIKDRNDNRAHPYELKKQGRAKMLDLSELRGITRSAERFMNDLRLLSAGGGGELAYTDLSDTPSEVFAEDLVDELLIGTAVRRCHVMNGQDREAFYADLHQVHDQLNPADQASRLWNDNPP